jgi:large subunit ribosomal protein L4
MNAKALTFKDAAAKLATELIENNRGTQAVHETVVAYRANRRAGTHSTLTKAGVNRSGKKPWRQKGTGRARAGYASSPIWRGGGVVFGPQPRDYSKKIPKKVKQLALRKAISARVGEGAMLLVNEIVLAKPKTAELAKQVNGLLTRKSSSLLIVLEAPDKNIYLAARNNPRIETTTGDQVNAEDLLRYDKIIVTEGALSKLAARLKKKE